MPRFFSTLALIAWALWLGGLVALFIFVQRLFAPESRSIALEAAPRMFLVFEKYQLILAGISLLATFGWRLRHPSRRLGALFLLLALTTCGAATSAGLITPRLEALRLADQTHTPQFRRLHGESMMVFSSEVLLLLIAGLVLPAALHRDR